MIFSPVDEEDVSSQLFFPSKCGSARRNAEMALAAGRSSGEGVLQALSASAVLKRLPGGEKLSWLNLLVKACDSTAGATPLILHSLALAGLLLICCRP